MATAPVPVSGTAALVGIFKSFEELTGKKVTASVERTAAQELIATGNLGEKVGKEKAAVLVERAKEMITAKPTVTRDEVTKIIEQSAKEQNLTLSKQDKEQLTDLMMKIKLLNIDVKQLQSQLKNFTPNTPQPAQPGEKSLFSRILEFLKTLFSKFFSFVGKIFSGQ
jgi:uncharacterized protein YpuA (DUF1002 family)